MGGGGYLMMAVICTANSGAMGWDGMGLLHWSSLLSGHRAARLAHTLPCPTARPPCGVHSPAGTGELHT